MLLPHSQYMLTGLEPEQKAVMGSVKALALFHILHDYLEDFEVHEL